MSRGHTNSLFDAGGLLGPWRRVPASLAGLGHASPFKWPSHPRGQPDQSVRVTLLHYLTGRDPERQHGYGVP